MPISCGIKCQIISRTDFGVFPEFPHPDNSLFTRRKSPEHFEVDQTEIANIGGDRGGDEDGDTDEDRKFSTLTSALESKADQILGKETAVSVYIPTTPDARFWLRYKIKEVAEDCRCYYFKLFMNGREVASWGIPSKEGYDGQVTRALFDPTDEHIYNDTETGTLYKNMGLERRAFYFTENTGNSIATDGGLVELRVFRSSGRMRRVQEPAIYKCQENYGIVLNSGGLLHDAHLAKFYEWMLIDPINKPYTVFNFHYRSWDSLIAMALVPEDHDRKLDPVTPSILALYGLSVELQEKLDQKHFNKFVENIKPHRETKKPLNTRVPLTKQALERVPIHDLLRTRIRVRAQVMKLLEEDEELSGISTNGSERLDVEEESEARLRMFSPNSPNHGAVNDHPRLHPMHGEWSKKLPQTPRNTCKLEDGYIKDGYMIDSSSSSESESNFNPDDMGAPRQYNTQDPKDQFEYESLHTTRNVEGMNAKYGASLELEEESPSLKQNAPQYSQARDELCDPGISPESRNEEILSLRPSGLVEVQKDVLGFWDREKESSSHAKELPQRALPPRSTSRCPQTTAHRSDILSTLDLGDTPKKTLTRSRENAQLAEYRQFQEGSLAYGHDRGEWQCDTSPESTPERKHAKTGPRPSTPYNHGSESDGSSKVSLDLAISEPKSHALGKAEDPLGMPTAQHYDSNSDSYSDSDIDTDTNDNRIDLDRAIHMPRSDALAKAKSFFGVGKSTKAKGKEKELLVHYELDEVAPKKPAILPFQRQMDHLDDTPPKKSLSTPHIPVGRSFANTPSSPLNPPEELAVTGAIHPDIFSWLEYQSGPVTLDGEITEMEPYCSRPLPSVAKSFRSAQSARPLPVIPTRGRISTTTPPSAELLHSVTNRPSISSVASGTYNSPYSFAVVNDGSSGSGQEGPGHHVHSCADSAASSEISSAHTTDSLTCVDASTGLLYKGSSTFDISRMTNNEDHFSPAPFDGYITPAARALPAPPTTSKYAVGALPALPFIPTAPLNITLTTCDIPIPSIECSPSPAIVPMSKFNAKSSETKTASASTSKLTREDKTLPAIPHFSTRTPMQNCHAQNHTVRPQRSLSTKSSSAEVSTVSVPIKKPERQRGFRSSLDVFTRKLKGLKRDEVD